MKLDVGRLTILFVVGVVWLHTSPSIALAQKQTVRAQAQSRAQANDSKAILARADFYYKNDDITKDRAATYYRQVRDQFPNSKDAETAQYFLGSYYHHKFYIQREKQLKEDVALLVEAEGQYGDYVNRYAWRSKSPDWLSDAYFNLALVALQRGDTYKAEQWLGKMYGASPYDQTVYVYQVIWSPKSQDVVDVTVDAKSLSEYTNSLVYSLRQQRLSSFDALIQKVKFWCASQKRSQSGK